MNDLIAITIIDAVNDNVLSIIVDEPRQPLWAATGLYSVEEMNDYMTHLMELTE